MNYGKHDLKAIRIGAAGRVACPVAGCARDLPRQQKQFQRSEEFRCPDHHIFVSPSTFEYEDELDNLLWKDVEDLRLFAKLSSVKRESRMARERSEDAVTRNVIRGLEKADALGSWLEAVSGLEATRPSVAYWSCDNGTGCSLGLLDEARRAFGETPNKGTEPDAIVVAESTLFFVEAKFTSGNRTQPSEAGRAARYVEGGQGWYAQVMRAPFGEVAVGAHFYELVRMWLLGTWAARQRGLDFCLVNLVGAARELGVEAAFGRFITTSDQRRFKRATWEGALAHLQAVRPLDPITTQLEHYMREKTAGYGSNGRLRSGFSL